VDGGVVEVCDPANVGSASTELSREVKSALDHGGSMSSILEFMSASMLKSALRGVGGVKLNAGVSAPVYGMARVL